VLVLTGSLDFDAFAAASALPDSLRLMDATRRMVDVSGAGHLEVPVAEAASRSARGSPAAGSTAVVGAARSTALASLTETSDSRPSATAATQTITTPSPVKNPICSIALAMWPPTGKP